MSVMDAAPELLVAPPTAYVDAIAIIDAALIDIGGRSLVSTDEMADVLLDLRAKFSIN